MNATTQTIFITLSPGGDPVSHAVDMDHYLFIKQALDDGFLQHVSIFVDGVHVDCWMDENGKNKGLPATLSMPGDTFVGPLVFTSSAVDGNTSGLTETQRLAVANLLHGRASSVEWLG